MNFDETAEHAALRRTAREYLAKELPEAKIREMDRARRIPRDLWKRFAELGWMGLAVPERFGGSGADVMSAAILTEEISRRFPSIGSCSACPFSFVAAE